MANLGGRDEWGAGRIADQHFALPPGRHGFKLVVVKVNSHVAFETSPSVGVGASGTAEGFRFGHMKRYGVDSPCCGALAALLDDAREPFGEDLRETFHSEGIDRIATLLDETRVDPTYRPLYAALVSARLQARKVVLDIQDYAPVTPTFFLVLPAVTINRPERDTEIVCGLYTIDGRRGGREAEYYGLGDDPADYEAGMENRRFTVEDEHVGSTRKGRDHRAMVLEEYRSRTGDRPTDVRDERLDRVRADVARNKHKHHRHARQLLRAALPILAQVAPIPAAILLFAEGAVGIHHAFRVHQLSKQMSGTEEAREILGEIHDRVDQLPPERAEALIEILMREYRP